MHLPEIGVELDKLFEQHYQNEISQETNTTTVRETERARNTWKVKGSKKIHQNAMWFELLADIAILVALYKMSLENPFRSFEDGFRVAAKFTFIWQIWFGQVLLCSSFDTHYFPFRFLQLCQILSICIIGITRPFAASNAMAYLVFVITIISSKAVLLIQLGISVMIYDTDYFRIQLPWIMTIFVEIMMWALTLEFSTVTDNDYNSVIWLWRVGVLLELVGSLYSSYCSTKLSALFLQNRFSLLTIAMLGKLWFGITIFIQDFTIQALILVVAHTILIFSFWRIYYFSSMINDFNNISLWLFFHYLFHLLLFIGTSAAYDIIALHGSREMVIELTSLSVALLLLATINSFDKDRRKRISFVIGRVICAFAIIFVVFSLNISEYSQYQIGLIVTSALVCTLMVEEWLLQQIYLKSDMDDSL